MKQLNRIKRQEVLEKKLEDLCHHCQIDELKKSKKENE
jgi:hypothetical protein